MILRPAGPGDAPGCAAVHVRGWQTTYAALAPGVLDLRPEDRLARWQELLDGDEADTVRVLEDAERVVGLVRAVPGHCRLALLYLDAGRQGQGWGRRLHDAGLDLLRAAQCRHAELWTLEGNTGARAFYAARGWTPDGRRRDLDVAGTPLVEVGYRRAL